MYIFLASNNHTNIPNMLQKKILVFFFYFSTNFTSGKFKKTPHFLISYPSAIIYHFFNIPCHFNIRKGILILNSEVGFDHLFYLFSADWTAVSMGPQWSLATLTDTEMPDKSK